MPINAGLNFSKIENREVGYKIKSAKEIPPTLEPVKFKDIMPPYLKAARDYETAYLLLENKLKIKDQFSENTSHSDIEITKRGLQIKCYRHAMRLIEEHYL